MLNGLFALFFYRTCCQTCGIECVSVSTKPRIEIYNLDIMFQLLQVMLQHTILKTNTMVTDMLTSNGLYLRLMIFFMIFLIVLTGYLMRLTIRWRFR